MRACINSRGLSCEGQRVVAQQARRLTNRRVLHLHLCTAHFLLSSPLPVLLALHLLLPPCCQAPCWSALLLRPPSLTFYVRLLDFYQQAVCTLTPISCPAHSRGNTTFFLVGIETKKEILMDGLHMAVPHLWGPTTRHSNIQGQDKAPNHGITDTEKPLKTNPANHNELLQSCFPLCVPSVVLVLLRGSLISPDQRGWVANNPNTAVPLLTSLYPTNCASVCRPVRRKAN